MGLFRPGEGRVFHDGTDIRVLGEDELYKGQTALFQKFNCYQASVLENITFADRGESDSLADRIIVLDKGRILEEGTHAQLLEKGGKYAEFWNAQVGMYSDYKKTLL